MNAELHTDDDEDNDELYFDSDNNDDAQEYVMIKK